MTAYFLRHACQRFRIAGQKTSASPMATATSCTGSGRSNVGMTSPTTPILVSVLAALIGLASPVAGAQRGAALNRAEFVVGVPHVARVLLEVQPGGRVEIVSHETEFPASRT